MHLVTSKSSHICNNKKYRFVGKFCQEHLQNSIDIQDFQEESEILVDFPSC